MLHTDRLMLHTDRQTPRTFQLQIRTLHQQHKKEPYIGYQQHLEQSDT